MMIEIRLPQIDENVTEYTIGHVLKNVGDSIALNEVFIEVETDKVSMEVAAEAAGVIKEILIEPGDVMRPGDLLARLSPISAVAQPEREPAQAVTSTLPIKTVAVPPKRETRMSPVVGRMVAEHGIDISAVAGSGRHGRVTKKDVVAYLQREAVKPVPAAVVVEPEPVVVQPEPMPRANGQTPDLIPLSNMRRSIADHMVRSLATSPHVTTIFEFDFGRVAAHRAKYKQAFAADGIKLTYMAYIAYATVEALKKFPVVNSQFHENGIELKKEINLGVIVAVPDGLYAPVIHHADEYNLKGLARAVGDLSARATSGQLKAADMQGGTFTISNHGSAGSIAGTPIIFQPQAGILGVGAIEKRVKVIDDGIHIRPCAYISFSFDHRVMDGAISDGFCSEIKRIIESWPVD